MKNSTRWIIIIVITTLIILATTLSLYSYKNYENIYEEAGNSYSKETESQMTEDSSGYSIVELILYQ